MLSFGDDIGGIPGLGGTRPPTGLLRKTVYNVAGTYSWTKGYGTTYISVSLSGGGGGGGGGAGGGGNGNPGANGAESSFGSYVTSTTGNGDIYIFPGVGGVSPGTATTGLVGSYGGAGIGGAVTTGAGAGGLGGQASAGGSSGCGDGANNGGAGGNGSGGAAGYTMDVTGFSQNVTVTVGAGGAGGTSNNQAGTAGSDGFVVIYEYA